MLIEYEDLLFKPDEVLLRLEYRFNLEPVGMPVISEKLAMPRAGDEHSSRWFAIYGGKPFDRSYYDEKRYMKKISPELQKKIVFCLSSRGYFINL